MNKNTKLFGVLVAALFTFAVFASAQQGFDDFVQYGDWEFDIDIEEYCTFNTGAPTGQTCGIFTTDAGGNATKGDLYLGNTTEAGSDNEIIEGMIRLFNTNGFDAGTVVEDGDADEGAFATQDTEAVFGWADIVAGTTATTEFLNNAEIGMFYVDADNNGVISEDDVSLADDARVGEDDDLEGTSIVGFSSHLLFADMDDGGSKDFDTDEPLFINVNTTTDNTPPATVTEGDLELVGGEWVRVGTDNDHLALPALVSLGTGYKLGVRGNQTAFNDNGYSGEDLILINITDSDVNNAKEIGEDSILLTGSQAGTVISDSHALWGREYVDLDHSGAEDYVFCVLVGDEDDDNVTMFDDVFMQPDEDTCKGDADEGAMNMVTGQVSPGVDGDLVDYQHAVADGVNGHVFNSTHWYFLDLDGDEELDNGEPISWSGPTATSLSILDLVISQDGSRVADLGFQYMGPTEVPLQLNQSAAPDWTTDVQVCTLVLEDEDEFGNDAWYPQAIILRGGHSETEPCEDEDEVDDHDFVLAGSMHVGTFLYDADGDLDDFDGLEFINETGEFEQPDYKLYYQDNFPSGYGAEDVTFLVPLDAQKLTDESFYLGGPVLDDEDEWFNTKLSDLVELAPDLDDGHFVVLEGDDKTGLSPADWFFLKNDDTVGINDNSLILYKPGGTGPEPSPTETTSPSPTETTSPSPTDTSSPTPTDTSSPTPTDTSSPSPTGTQQTPGFELVALIAALGAAFVLLRRRL